MAVVCADSCPRNEKFIEENITAEGFGNRICCCQCPALEKCKGMNDGIGCIKAKTGEFDYNSCSECDLSTDES